MAEDQNTEDQTLDKIEAKPKKPKKKIKLSLNFDLIIALLLVSITLAMVIWWYLEISKI